MPLIKELHDLIYNLRGVQDDLTKLIILCQRICIIVQADDALIQAFD